MSVTFLIPTIGRATLKRTLDSIETLPGDEILVVADYSTNVHMQDFVMKRPGVRYVSCPKGGDWGHAERNFSMQYARGRYIAHIDDDDWYAPGVRALMSQAMSEAPGRPILFRMQFPNGITLWQDKEIRCGNVGTPMMLIPNRPTMLGRWGSFVGGDFAFLESSKWKADDYHWRPEVIALLGHNPGQPLPEQPIQKITVEVV